MFKIALLFFFLPPVNVTQCPWRKKTFNILKEENVWNFSLFALLALAITWYQLAWILCWHRDNSGEVTTPIRPTQILMLELFVTPTIFKTRHIKDWEQRQVYRWWNIYLFEGNEKHSLSAFITIFMRVFMGEGGLFGQITGEGVGSGNWSVPYNTDIKLS